MKNQLSGDVCQICCLAENDLGAVSICTDCGVVHLTLQNISIRLHADVFQELARMIGEAHLSLERLVQDTLLAAGQGSMVEQFGLMRTKTH